jgi:tetratricopeptide (TPR) repeat protein
LLREYAGALQSVSEKQPVLIVVDDLHWSDAGSIRLLSHLARVVVNMPVMLVCAYRPSDVEVEGHPLKGLINEIVRYNTEATLELPSLSPEGVRALLQTRFPSNKLPATLPEDLHARTGGAPLFVLESLRLMQTRGEFKRDEADGKWMLTRELTDEDLPRSVEAVVNKRIERLPDDLRRALALAAVQGPIFETEVLAYVTGKEEVDVMRMLEPAERPHDIIDYIGDVEVGDDVTSRFRFNSTLFQRELLDSLRGKQRMIAHRKTAEGIEKLWKDETDDYSAQLAMHYEKGRMWEKSAGYMIDAAQRARRAGETENGIKRFEHAERLLRRTPTGPSMEQQIEIDEGLSYLYDLDSRYEQAESRIRHALALNAMHHKLDWRRSIMLKMRLANLTGDKGRHAEAMQMLQDLYAELNRDFREHTGSLEAFRLRAALAFSYTQMGKDEEGIQLAQESLNALSALPRGSQDRDENEAWKTVEVELRSALAASYFGRGEYGKAIEIATEVLQVAEKLDLMDTVLLVQDRLAEMNLAIGHYDKAYEYADKMERTAKELSNESGLAMAHVVRARALRLQDDNGGALRELEKADALVEQFSWFSDQPQMMAIRAAALIGQHRLDEAQALLDTADDIAATSGIAEWSAYVKFMHARYEMALRNFDAAADMAGDAARVFEQEWAYFEQAQAIRLVALAHLAAGNTGTAQHHFKQALEIFERIGNETQARQTRDYMST